MKKEDLINSFFKDKDAYCVIHILDITDDAVITQEAWYCDGFHSISADYTDNQIRTYNQNGMFSNFEEFVYWLMIRFTKITQEEFDEIYYTSKKLSRAINYLKKRHKTKKEEIVPFLDLNNL